MSEFKITEELQARAQAQYYLNVLEDLKKVLNEGDHE